ncbi:carbon monoxide dehydrogenase medium subunit [Rhodococcus aetherivorans]|nr:carbon monoxide dehydrogenase medium subunit [Rhodococcus aetherivorans]
MIPSTFDYVAPTTIDEAVAALAAAGEDAKIIAGGQSLMPVLRLRLAAPTTLVDLGRVPDLRGGARGRRRPRDRRDDHPPRRDPRSARA